MRGFQCSTEKCALLILKGNPRGRTLQLSTIQFKLQGCDIPILQTIRILGLYIQQDGGGTLTIQCLDHTILQILRVVNRAPNLHQGMKEDDVIKLVQALVASGIEYRYPLPPAEIKGNGPTRHTPA
ncbi:hypothetical protein HPB48_015288 [Haemaphysalis longicornis]|uniref:Uncharacterized protein n=1 Tax=Haemaphysalis longicornis TaxID=44386 RepID=A0A9J6GU22_HAELO|nr:hypothetical protein HPB48_015288 [Haemaphysalis longicornis]